MITNTTTEQEWMPSTIEMIALANPRNFHYVLAEKINASIAAERDKADNLFKVSRKHCVENQELKQQLAAEREEGVKALAQRSFELHDCQQQRKEAYRQGHDDIFGAMDAENQQLKQQLGAERERHDRAQERATKWFDLLAAERDKHSHSRLHVDLAEARSQLDEAVEALKLLHDDVAEYARINNLGGFDNHAMKLARAALAKLGDGK